MDLDGEVGLNFRLAGVRCGPAPAVDLDEVELETKDVEEPAMKSFIDICLIFVFVLVVLLAVCIPAPEREPDGMGALKVNEYDLSAPPAAASPKPPMYQYTKFYYLNSTN